MPKFGAFLPRLVQTVRGRMKNKALAYGYANARVHAMKANLLSQEQMEKLILVESTGSLIGLLETTHYKNDISALSVKYKGEELVEMATGRNFARDANKMLRIAPKGARGAVAAILRRYDITNIKTILLGHALSRKEEIRELLIPAGELGEKMLNRMAGAKDLREALSFLRGGLYQIPRELEERGNVEGIIEHVEKKYYENLEAGAAALAGESEGKALLELAEMEIDAKNLMNALREKALLQKGKKCSGTQMINGGKLKQRFMLELGRAQTLEDAVGAVESQLGMAGMAGRFSKEKSLAGVEVEIEKRTARKKLHSFHRSVLSLGALVGYLFLKGQEMANIRKIVRGKQYGLSPQQIREMLITVN